MNPKLIKNNQFLKWDPSWGFKNKIYYLGASYEKDKPFHALKNHLFSGNTKIFSAPTSSRLCAGSFTKNNYFGSLSYDSWNKSNSLPETDQSIFCCNKDWEIITEFRPSLFFSKENKYFSMLKNNNKLVIPFRDPSPINDSNSFSVCTGGWRWGLRGNVCEIKFENNLLSITKETIIDDDMRCFSEIERCTFWNEFMFFSVNGGENTNINNNKIQVAKLSRNGLYKYYGEVKNSEDLYGPDVNSKLKILFWYKNIYKINNPYFQNLYYENGDWIIRKIDINKKFFHIKSKLKDKFSKPKTKIHNIKNKIKDKFFN